jgi:hypothetical protein
MGQENKEFEGRLVVWVAFMPEGVGFQFLLPDALPKMAGAQIAAKITYDGEKRAWGFLFEPWAAVNPYARAGVLMAWESQQDRVHSLYETKKAKERTA